MPKPSVNRTRTGARVDWTAERQVEIFPNRSQPLEGDLVHYLQRHRLLFGLSLILDNFSARFVFQLNI